jgi:hypothetical protein
VVLSLIMGSLKLSAEANSQAMTPCTTSKGESNARAGKASRDERRDASASDAEEGGSVAGLTAVTTPAAAAKKKKKRARSGPGPADEVQTPTPTPYTQPATLVFTPNPDPRHPRPDTRDPKPDTNSSVSTYCLDPSLFETMVNIDAWRISVSSDNVGDFDAVCSVLGQRQRSQ